MKPSQSLISQCNKFMFSFYDYLPTRYKEASPRDWQVRKFVWGFKDGKYSMEAAQIVAKKLIEVYGDNVQKIVFACIPASSKQKTIIRYKKFAEEVCRLSGAQNAFSAISVEGERLAIHEYKNSKKLQDTEVINFDERFFSGKKVVVFDDIVTRGFSYARFACHLEKIGAVVLGGLFLAKTINF